MASIKFDSCHKDYQNTTNMKESAEMLKAERMEKFSMLLALSETYRHKNQYE